MSERDNISASGGVLWRARAIAERIMDENSAVIDTHEGTFLALQLAYAEGVSDGSDTTLNLLRGELAKL